MNPNDVDANVAAPEQLISDAPKMGYWKRTERGYVISFRVVLILLVLFAVLFAVLCYDTISYDSFFYFGKDLRAIASLADRDANTVTYTHGNGDSDHLAYRGGVAVVHTEGIEVYSAGGNALLTVEREFAAPRGTGSREYLLAYDFGGRSFSVCNSYAELYCGESDFPIYDAVVSDTGYFMLVTASDEALSQVLLYDGSFHLVQRFLRGSATVDAAFSENGRYIALLGATANGGVLDVLEVGSTEPLQSRTFEREFPLAVTFTSSTTLTVVTDHRAYSLHVSGKAYETFDLAGRYPMLIDSEKECCVMVLIPEHAGEPYRAVALNRKGKIKCNVAIEGVPRRISVAQDTLWVLTDTHVTAIDPETGATLLTAPVRDNATELFALDERSAYVFYTAEAEKISADRSKSKG